VPGVADVNALGGKVRSFEVVPDPVRLAALGCRPPAQAAIDANNRNDGAGRLGEGDEVLLVRSEGSIRTKDDLMAIVVKYDKSGSVRLQDVAEVRDGSVTRYGVVTRTARARPCKAWCWAWPAPMRRRWKASPARSRRSSPPCPRASNSRCSTTARKLVEKAVGTVSKRADGGHRAGAGAAGAFLGNVRAALSVALVLPLSAGHLHADALVGMSANLMSLGGLAIALGMLVDAAVVVVENIVQHQARTARASCRAAHRVPRGARGGGAVAAGMLIIASCSCRC
jgi:cobalt-zinc-cadmium resistance protein CzcA